MQKGIIGKKIGMTQVFDENGKVVPVTVVVAGPCTVVQKKTVESDGFGNGFGQIPAPAPAILSSGAGAWSGQKTVDTLSIAQNGALCMDLGCFFAGRAQVVPTSCE